MASLSRAFRRAFRAASAWLRRGLHPPHGPVHPPHFG